MRVAIYDRIEPSMPAALPLRLAQRCSQRTAATLLLLGIPAALIAITAAVVILTEAAVAPQARTLFLERPVLIIEILFAIAFVSYLAVLPTKRLIDRLTMTRIVDIANGVVTVAEGGHFQTWSWSAPLAQYRGITHHTRSSLSGTRHEIILVHPQREKSILLCVAAKTSQGEVDRICALLGQSQVPASELYRFNGLWPRVGTQPLTDASHA